MKVEGPGKSSGVKGAGKAGAKKGADGADFSGLLEETAGTESAKPMSGVMSIGQLDSLLALQEAGDGTSGKKAKQRAQSLLDMLDEVKVGLLTGGISQGLLNELSQTVAGHRNKVMDPALADVLDEIDLRVQVELAKLGQV